MPAAKQKENIANIIRAVSNGKVLHILIIEDNSPDGQATIAE